MNTLGTLWEQRGTLPISSLFWILCQPAFINAIVSLIQHDFSSSLKALFSAFIVPTSFEIL